ncbi:sporulation protein [Parazoarcus communis]|uniref:Sporulation protein n=1 Tax=Parazoarcus communis TaxID=41977 RepID=A0A2U8H3L2_9RHOO|nr:SPOR domain-containing protein [Parazoarcus communis]AWI80238.1 sporulation protein [Parazoarcus communis]
MSDTDNLEIKKRARRRLVGAAALALLAAIVLPMAMDQEPQLSSQDIQISIPDREATASQARPIAPSQPVVASEPDVAPAPIEQPPVNSPPPAVATTSPAPAAEAPASPPKPAASPSREEDEAARVKALLSGAAVPAAAASSESFVIQIGAFSDEAKASALAADLKKKGFAAYTEKAGKVTRVRVGPVPARSDAEKLAAKLRSQGHNAVLAAR